MTLYLALALIATGWILGQVFRLPKSKDADIESVLRDRKRRNELAQKARRALQGVRYGDVEVESVET